MIHQIAELDDKPIGRNRMFESGEIAMHIAHHAQTATGAQLRQIGKMRGRKGNRIGLSGLGRQSTIMGGIGRKTQ
ncbi:hypothetical protein AA105894_0745 [Asaia spathodeae NBRC 105894]|nr:hypothetical protein AA105894_0745 [Asaia spathodeae NBRC 105894]